MKTYLTILYTTILFVFGYSTNAQTFNYSYDTRGNRIVRNVTTVKLNEEDFTNEENTAFIGVELQTDQNQEIQITNEINQTQINIYPNPATNVLNINITGANLDKKTMVYVYSLTGKLLQQQNIDSNSTQIDLSRLANGAYFIKIKTTNYIYQQKIIKQ